MKKYGKIAFALLLSASMIAPIYSQTFPNMTEQEYREAQRARITEEKGLVIENHPDLGYLVYVNEKGKKVTRSYYRNEVKVEKQSYYEVEDLIGYIDEMFPSFQFDPRDTTAEHIQPGDYIYMHLSQDGVITHASLSNNHIVRYGRVKQFTPGGMDDSTMILEDEQGQVFHMEIPSQTPVTKGGIPSGVSHIQEGDWVKVLVSQGVTAPGTTVEYVKEIVIDRGSRVISNIYRGQLTHIDAYQHNLYLQNTQAMQKIGWGPYQNIKTLKVDPRVAQSYYMGNLVSWDYVGRYLKHQPGYVYIAMEKYYGAERAVKLDFQSLHQRTLPSTTIISAQPGQIKLLSGEIVYVSSDTIIRRNGRLVDPHSIMPSDYAQVVISGENKAAVIDIREKPTMGSIQVFRGRIKKIKDYETFEVETFALLEDTLWMYHPIPRTFTMDNQTKLYDESGLVDEGIETFIDYGENAQLDEVYTAIVVGDYAQAIIKMPYTRYSVRGEVYETADNEVKIKDTYLYHIDRKRWEIKGRKETTENISLAEQAVIIKNGKVVPARALERGDRIRIMTDSDPRETSGGVQGYLIIVEE